MKRAHFTAIARIILLILLFECGLFSFASRLESQSPPQPNLQEIIVSMGDSITTGYGVDHYEETYVYRLFSQTGLTAVNRGVPGAHSSDGAATVVSVLQQYNPRYLTIYFGNNDAGFDPTAEVIANLRYMVERCLSNGTTPIIATLGPQFDDPYSNFDWAWRQPYINAINSGIRQLAAEKHIPLADIEAGLNWDQQYYYDSIHPNAAGHAIIAARFAAFIEHCSYFINPSSASHNGTVETGSVAVTTSPACSWTATSNASWISVTGGGSGKGSATVNYNVDANRTGSDRTGTISIAGKTFTITQYAVSVIDVTPASLDFGYVLVGSTKELSVTVKNTGGSILTGNATTTAPFSVISGESYNLGPAQSQAVTIRYLPPLPDTHTGVVVFTGGAGASVPVTGTNGCSGDAVELQNVTFASGNTYNCTATTSITAGTGVTVQNGAIVNFRAPIINLLPGFRIESGAMFSAKP